MPRSRRRVQPARVCWRYVGQAQNGVGARGSISDAQAPGGARLHGILLLPKSMSFFVFDSGIFSSSLTIIAIGPGTHTDDDASGLVSRRGEMKLGRCRTTRKELFHYSRVISNSLASPGSLKNAGSILGSFFIYIRNWGLYKSNFNAH